MCADTDLAIFCHKQAENFVLDYERELLRMQWQIGLRLKISLQNKSNCNNLFNFGSNSKS